MPDKARPDLIAVIKKRQKHELPLVVSFIRGRVWTGTEIANMEATFFSSVSRHVPS